MHTLEYTLPARWSSYLINGDDSGIESADKADCDAFLAKESKPFPISFCDVKEPYFSRHCDASGQLAGEMADYTAMIEN